MANTTSVKGSNKDSYVADDLYVNPPGSTRFLSEIWLAIPRCAGGVMDKGRCIISVVTAWKYAIVVADAHTIFRYISYDHHPSLHFKLALSLTS